MGTRTQFRTKCAILDKKGGFGKNGGYLDKSRGEYSDNLSQFLDEQKVPVV